MSATRSNGYSARVTSYLVSILSNSKLTCQDIPAGQQHYITRMRLRKGQVIHPQIAFPEHVQLERKARIRRFRIALAWRLKLNPQTARAFRQPEKRLGNVGVEHLVIFVDHVHGHGAV